MRRRRAKAGGDGGDRWLATYGDMVTLLMAFFVMMFAVSSVEQEKFEAFLSGLGQFDNPAASHEPIRSPIGDPVTPPMAPLSPPGGSGAADGGRREAMEALGSEILAAVRDAGFAGKVELEYETRGLSVVIGTDHVLFDTGSAEITEQGRRIIAALAPTLTGLPNDLLVEGHADTTPLQRGGYTNWNLSTDRAVSVVNLLVAAHGIAPHRLVASGLGEFDPRDPADDAAAKARNRRVEIVVDLPEEPSIAPSLSDAAAPSLAPSGPGS